MDEHRENGLGGENNIPEQEEMLLPTEPILPEEDFEKIPDEISGSGQEQPGELNSENDGEKGYGFYSEKVYAEDQKQNVDRYTCRCAGGSFIYNNRRWSYAF